MAFISLVVPCLMKVKAPVPAVRVKAPEPAKTAMKSRI
jgi:hypothetical protein